MTDKEKRKLYMQAWWKKNKEKAITKQKQWRDNNKDKIKAYSKAYKSNRSPEQKARDDEHIRNWHKVNKERDKANRAIRNQLAPDLIRARRKRWSDKYPEKASAVKKKSIKKWKTNNKEHVLDYNRKRRKNPIRRIAQNINRHIRKSLRAIGSKKTSKSQSILGCTYPEFKSYLESKFQSWMTWDNYGKYNGTKDFGWDLDHVTPIVTAKSIEEVIKLNHYANYQPLCSYVNRHIKRDKVD